MNNATQTATEKKVTISTVRQIAKCKCGAARSRTIKATTTRWYCSDKIAPVSKSTRFEGEVAVDCACGKALRFVDVKGTYRADKKCDARCLNSTGHVCECSCGGKNHGAGHGA